MNLEQAKSLIGDPIQFEFENVYMSGTIVYVFETHELGKTKVSLRIMNNQGLRDRDYLADYDPNKITKFRKLDGEWQR